MGIGYESYFYDCGAYRAYGNELFQNGKYNLLNLSDGFRGYIFPTVLGFSEFLDSLIGIKLPVCFKLFTSIIVGCFFTWSIPRLVTGLFKKRKTIKRYKTFINLFFIMIFFWGLFIYPLTDILAMILCINAVICIMGAMNTEEIKKKIVLLLLSGILIYASYNVRSIYIFSVVMAFIMIIIMNMKKREGKRGIVYVLSFLLGIFLCSIPQIIVNYHTLGKVSIMLPTNSLMIQQLEWGMYYQRYETYVGNIHNSAKLIFQDKSGFKILEILGEIESIKDYILAAFRYPLDFIGIYARHIFNMLCPIYPEQFIIDLEKNRSVLIVLNYTILYVFIVWCTTGINQMMPNSAKRIDIDGFMGILTLLLPSVFIMPGAVEQRFSITIYVLICSYIVYCIDFKVLVITLKEEWIKYTLIFGVGMFIVLAIWGNTLSNLNITNLIIGY